jgi:hypothetical protein
MKIVTLGHGLLYNCAYHEYWGDWDKVGRDLSGMVGWEKGLVTIQPGGISRDGGGRVTSISDVRVVAPPKATQTRTSLIPARRAAVPAPVPVFGPMNGTTKGGQARDRLGRPGDQTDFARDARRTTLRVWQESMPRCSRTTRRRHTTCSP